MIHIANNGGMSVVSNQSRRFLLLKFFLDRLLLKFFVGLFSAIFTFSAYRCHAQVPYLPVLVYHHIEDNPSSDVSCTPTQFSEHIKAILKNGFKPLTLIETRLFLSGALNYTKRPILITFDDGYESIYTYAFPIATQLRVPMTVFLITSRIGLKPQFIQYLSIDQIGEMVRSGFFDFGSHTHDLHVNNIVIYNAFRSSPNPFLTHLEADLTQSREVINLIASQSVFAISWPYGKFNWEMTKVARKCGFFLHFTSIRGYNEPGSNPLGIRRIPVTSRDTAESLLKKIGSSDPAIE